MTKIASPKLTGAGGTSFQDKVNAYFMACILSETPAFDSRYGLIEKLEVQTRADGWLFDDTLLHMHAGNNQGKIAVSVKSDRHFTSAGCPKEINAALWKQVLKIDSDIFDPAVDHLALVEAPVNKKVSENLSAVLTLAGQQDPADLYRRTRKGEYVSVGKRKILDSFLCPAEIQDTNKPSGDSGAIVAQYFLHKEMDFEAQNSNDETFTINLCKQCLRTKTQQQAGALYTRLCQVARDIDPKSGWVSKAKLVRLLGNDFQLEDFPSQATDWQKLKKHTNGKLSLVPNVLGNDLQLDRSKTIAEINKSLSAGKGCIIEGISGTGKSAMAKLYALRLPGNSHVIWLDAADVEYHSITQALNISGDLQPLLENAGSFSPLLIIDGADKFYAQGQQQQLLELIQMTMDENCQHWKIIFTCPSDEVEKFLRDFSLKKINLRHFTRVSIPEINNEEILRITQTFPGVKRLFIDDKMRGVLNNLKLLDSIVTASVSGILDANLALGESMLIDFIWQTEIERSAQGMAKAHLMKVIAEKQADTLSSTIRSSDLQSVDIQIAQLLMDARLVKAVDERWTFTHDLYGDWGLYRLLLSQGQELKKFLAQKHLSSPLWARSLRLYGLSLLEKQPEQKTWLTIYQEFEDDSTQGKIIQDILLESLLISSRSAEYLRANRDFFFADKGIVFSKLLQVFRIRATKENPVIRAIAEERNISPAEAAEFDRIPVYLYWPPMLQYIAENIDQVHERDWGNLAALALIWLRHTSEGIPGRSEAGGVAIYLAGKMSDWHRDGTAQKDTFHAALLAYSEHPQEVKTLCLRTCKRIDKPAVKQKTSETDTLPQPRTFLFGPQAEMRAPWPDGPHSTVPSFFQEICVETDALTIILEKNPDLAVEILLAVVIDEPKENIRQISYSSDHCIFEPLAWYPPFYLRGPFLVFFRSSPFAMITFLVKLVDFITEREMEQDDESGPARPPILIEYKGEQKPLYGNQIVYAWNKDVGNLSHLPVSLLMAFEEFLYTEIELGREINKYVTAAMDQTSSIAIVGLLLTVAKKEKSLFTNELRSLLGVYEWYQWDNHTGMTDQMKFWGMLPSAWHKDLEQWINRKYRFSDLRDIILSLFLIDQKLQKDFVEIVDGWKSRLVALKMQGDTDIFLDRLISFFQIENYGVTRKEGRTSYEYREPEELTARLADGRAATNDILEDGIFAFKCYQEITSNTLMDSEEAERRWQKMLVDVSQIKDQEVVLTDQWQRWNQTHTNILAAIAVLLKNKDAWTIHHPEHLQIMRKWVADLMQTLTDARKLFTGPGTDHDLPSFLAMIVPILWRDDQQDKAIRSILAQVCVLFSAQTTTTLFKTIGLHFSWNDPQFIQLQNLLLKSSTARVKFSNWRAETDDQLVDEMFDLIHEFTENNIESAPLQWSQIHFVGKKKRKKRYQRPNAPDEGQPVAGFDHELSLALLESLPEYITLEGENKKYIRRIWHQAFGEMLYELGPPEKLISPIEDWPKDLHTKVIENIAVVMVVAETLEEADEFWRPLFDYGYLAHRWIQRLCTYFYLHNITHPDRHQQMADIFGRMIAYVTNHPNWQKAASRHEDFSICIGGMDSNILSIWGDDFTPFTSLSAAHYENWFARNWTNRYYIGALMAFLVTRSGEFIIEKALPLIESYFNVMDKAAKMPPPEGRVFVGDPENDKRLSAALIYVWTHKRALLLQNKVLMKIFQNLLQYLVRINNVSAIDLQKQMVLG